MVAVSVKRSILHKELGRKVEILKHMTLEVLQLKIKTSLNKKYKKKKKTSLNFQHMS